MTPKVSEIPRERRSIAPPLYLHIYTNIAALYPQTVTVLRSVSLQEKRVECAFVVGAARVFGREGDLILDGAFLKPC